MLLIIYGRSHLQIKGFRNVSSTGNARFCTYCAHFSGNRHHYLVLDQNAKINA